MITIKVGERNKKQEIVNKRQETRYKVQTNSKLQITNNQKTDNLQLTTDNLQIEEYIEDIKFKTLGCAAAIASSSMTTELAKGKSLDDALAISKDDINEALGKLPAPKYHCSILAAEGISRAIMDYRTKSKAQNPKS